MAYTTIDDPSVYFQTALYTGNNSNRSITNDGNSDLQPDWIWGKSRSNSDSPTATDSSRGNTKVLTPSATEAEGTASDYVTAFNSDGFSLGTNNGMNKNTLTYVAWQWKANGGTTTTNDASSTSVGTIDSVYQANTTAGFSIVTWTGTGSAGTVAHGLGAVPQLIITKNRTDNSTNWQIYHGFNTSAPETEVIYFTTGATQDYDGFMSDTAPTSTVFSAGGDGSMSGTSGKNIVAYCFAPIQGYSKFGSYTANNSTDGPFVYLGFKPAWIMIRNTSAAADWPIADTKREVGNPFAQEILFANVNDAETSYANGVDFLSNGFKVRSTGSNGVFNANNTSHNFIYMAFAESPFVSSEGVPTTAR